MPQYEIIIKGGSAHDWSDWFRELRVRTVTDTEEKISEITLTGWFPDQSAMLGVIMRLHNLNLTILLVRKIKEQEITYER